MGYLKIETTEKANVISAIERVIEELEGHRIYVQKLDNGEYYLEIIPIMKKPPIS